MELWTKALQFERRSKLFAFIVLDFLPYSVVRILTLPDFGIEFPLLGPCEGQQFLKVRPIQL